MRENTRIRIGTGYDAHPLVLGRRLVLGGVEIPFDKGLDGWSDADVLTHAIMDALLGAAAMGNIGTHFPPVDPRFQGISSLKLLRTVKDRLAEKGWLVDNIDATVIAAQPKLNPFVEQMRQQLSLALVIPFDRVSVKASTSNGLGFAGRGEGIAAQSVALITGPAGPP
jgi:2-C-methyl-D-erythritol 2,4-cyclodiphosphate synthase